MNKGLNSPLTDSANGTRFYVMRAKTYYSIRNSLGMELFWTTSRTKALEWAALRNNGVAAFHGQQYGPCYVTRLVRI